MSFTHICYLSLVTLVAMQRIFEVRKSRFNEFNLRMRGAEEFASDHFKWMRLIHIMWLIGCVVESFLVQTPSDNLMIFGSVLFMLGQTLRWLAIETLGSRWTVKIFVLPGEPLVNKGIYKFLRHPNYLGVIIELFALPLIGGCFVTATLATLANLFLLRTRIHQEELALQHSLQLRHEFQ